MAAESASNNDSGGTCAIRAEQAEMGIDNLEGAPVIPQLTKADCEVPRTQAELRVWVDHIYREFGAISAGKTAFRLSQTRYLRLTGVRIPLGSFTVENDTEHMGAIAVRPAAATCTATIL